MTWRQRGGGLTEELRREPAGFGLPALPARLRPSSTAAMVCGFCSTGCSLDVHLRDGAPVNLSPTRSHPVNQGTACPKGWEALVPLRSPERATTPLARNANGGLEPVSWADALGIFVERFAAIGRRHGPAAVAFLGTGQLPSEELALFGALCKFGMGMVHGDGNTRQCMATSVVAYKETFGFDAPPYTYADLEASDVIVLWGSNLCVAHPILWERICRNPHQPEIVVVDPRRTETAMAATRHVPLAPKSDLVLAYGLAHLLVREGYIDTGFVESSTSGFRDFSRHVEGYTPRRVSEATGVPVTDLESLAHLIGRGRRVSLWWTMGVNQSHEATLTAEALIAVALMTGNVGRPGTGANSITGQCNAMGSRLFANTTSLFCGRDFTAPSDRAEVAGILGIDEDCIPSQASLAYDQILEGIVGGAIRGLWVVGTNPAHSWINRAHLDDVLGRLDFCVVQDMYASTDTTRHADLVLPAAGWGEKDGTFVNSERRIGRIKRVAAAPGEALADFHIFRLVAEAWGCGELFRSWDSPEAVFGILGRLSAGRPCDISGIDGYALLDQRGGVQWPYPAGTPAVDDQDQQRRLFADGRFYHPDGKARFRFGDPRPPAEATSRRYPFVLLTGRGSASQWHTGTRTDTSPLLRRLSPSEPYAELHPDDADHLGVAPGDRVAIRSARGAVVVRAFVTPTIGAGQVFLAMHWPGTNLLTQPSFDPSSRQPSYKYCAVDVSRPEPWE
ncbi:MAG: molybdopterin oxidoreductase family protein [Acidimicrobiia bacterium]